MMIIPNLKTMNTLLGAAALAAASGASAGVQVDLFEDRGAWEAAVGEPYTTIDFTGYPATTPLHDQYQHLGITFTEPSNNFDGYWPDWYLQDGWGVNGEGDIAFDFGTPMRAMAADFPGGFTVILYRDGQYVWHTSTEWFHQGPGHFEGLISSEPFDRVVFDTTFVASLDDLHFGLPIPAPAALSVVVLGILATGSRRRGDS